MEWLTHHIWTRLQFEILLKDFQLMMFTCLVWMVMVHSLPILRTATVLLWMMWHVLSIRTNQTSWKCSIPSPSDNYSVSLPICQSMYKVAFCHKNLMQQLKFVQIRCVYYVCILSITCLQFQLADETSVLLRVWQGIHVHATLRNSIQCMSCLSLIHI